MSSINIIAWRWGAAGQVTRNQRSLWRLSSIRQPTREINQKQLHTQLLVFRGTTTPRCNIIVPPTPQQGRKKEEWWRTHTFWGVERWKREEPTIPFVSLTLNCTNDDYWDWHAKLNWLGRLAKAAIEQDFTIFGHKTKMHTHSFLFSESTALEINTRIAAVGTRQ